VSSGRSPAAGGDRPAFTVIVPVRDVADYLTSCLDSVLEQGFDAVEVIAVDDGSTDGSPALLRERSARDARVRVLHTTEPLGPGPARNLALVEASAPYVLFLDGDDTLTPGSLAAIDARIGEAGEPDVVMFGFARSYPRRTGRAGPSFSGARPASHPAHDRATRSS
jgi:glycosyltransferase involved in cell wall biosynthesis